MQATLTAPAKTKTNGHAKPFYIDQGHLDSEMRDQSRTTRKIEAAKNTYEAITRDKIENLEQLREMVADPATYFVTRKAEEAQERQQKLTEVFGEGLDLKSFIKNSLPEKFIDIVSACRSIGAVRWEFYVITDGKIELSKLFHDKLINRCYFFATSPGSKTRLEFAKKMVELLDVEMRQLLIDQAREAGTEHAIEDNLRLTSFIAGLPCCVRMVRSYDGKYTYGKLLVNEQWVVHGFGQWVPNVIAPKKREERKQLVRLCTFEGKLMHFTGNVWPYSRHMQSQTVLYPNWYEVRGGRAYDTGKRAPKLSEHKMLFQPDRTPANIEQHESFLIVS